MVRIALIALFIDLCATIVLTLLVTSMQIRRDDVAPPLMLAVLSVPVYVIYTRFMTGHLLVYPVVAMLVYRVLGRGIEVVWFVVSGLVLFVALELRLGEVWAMSAFAYPDQPGKGLGWVVAISSLVGAWLAQWMSRQDS